MKLASLKWGRDGRLVVVSRDLAWCVEAGEFEHAREMFAATDPARSIFLQRRDYRSGTEKGHRIAGEMTAVAPLKGMAGNLMRPETASLSRSMMLIDSPPVLAT